MPCIYCYMLHEGYCKQNPQYWDGKVEVPAGSQDDE